MGATGIEMLTRTLPFRTARIPVFPRARSPRPDTGCPILRNSWNLLAAVAESGQRLISMSSRAEPLDETYVHADAVAVCRGFGDPAGSPSAVSASDLVTREQVSEVCDAPAPELDAAPAAGVPAEPWLDAAPGAGVPAEPWLACPPASPQPLRRMAPHPAARIDA